MSEEKYEAECPRLGGIPEARIQRYFCVDDDNVTRWLRYQKMPKSFKRSQRNCCDSGVVKGWIVDECRY